MPDTHMRILSLFSGAGGLDRGFVEAGHQVKLAVEWDKEACTTYRENFTDHDIWNTDIREVTGDKVREAVGEIDCIIGGPPCQPWSLAGARKGAYDERDMIPEFLRLVEEIKPKRLLMENVRGLLSWNDGKYFKAIIDRLTKAGYRVQFRVLDAADFGVPQRRHRVFIQGARDGLPIYWPVQTHSRDGGLFLRKWEGAGKALGLKINAPAPTITIGHGEVAGGRTSREFWERHGVSSTVSRSDGQPEVMLEDGFNQGAVRDLSEPSPVVRSSGTKHAIVEVVEDGPSNAVMTVEYKGYGPSDVRKHRKASVILAHWHHPEDEIEDGEDYDHGVITQDDPAPTIKSGGNVDASGHMGGGCPPAVIVDATDADGVTIRSHSAENGDGKEVAGPAPTVTADRGLEVHERAQGIGRRRTKRLRRLTPRECATLQSFPQDFTFLGTKTAQYRQIGNAVPVLLAQRIGEVIPVGMELPEGVDAAVFPESVIREALAKKPKSKKSEKKVEPKKTPDPLEGIDKSLIIPLF